MIMLLTWAVSRYLNDVSQDSHMTPDQCRSKKPSSVSFEGVRDFCPHRNSALGQKDKFKFMKKID